MSHYKVQVTIPMDSGVPEDASVNTWHCDALNLPAGYEDFVDDLEAFYQAIDVLLSTKVDAAGIHAKVYRMSDPTPRAPVYEKTFTGITTGTEAWPPELALCMSFQGARTSGIPQARRRGRVYIGPCSTLQASTTDPRISSGSVTALKNAGQALLLASQASIEYDWCVYSPSDDALVVVDNGWVDNAADVQRRRGLTADSRTVFN